MGDIHRQSLRGSASTELILKICIGFVLAAIVVACAVAVSLFRAQNERAQVAPAPSPQPPEEMVELATPERDAAAEKAAAFQYMRAVHTPGYSEPTPEELEWMQAANAQPGPNLSDAEVQVLLESM